MLAGLAGAAAGVGLVALLELLKKIRSDVIIWRNLRHIFWDIET